MTNPAHLLSVAVLLLAGFLIGAALGTLARLLVLRRIHKPSNPSVMAPIAAPAVTTPPLVAAPVIAPLAVAPPPAPPPPAEVPAPDFTATLLALAAEPPPEAFVEANNVRAELSDAKPPPPLRVVPDSGALPVAAEPALVDEMRPARVAGETTSGRLVAAPLHENPPKPAEATAVDTLLPSADVIPFAPAAVAPTNEALSKVPDAEVLVPEAPVAAEPEQRDEVVPLGDVQSPSVDDTFVEPPFVKGKTSGAPTPEPAIVIDEDAAMRAIEGNWTPRRPPAQRARPVPPPEGADEAVAASARAVAAARRAAETTIAVAALEAGRPSGLDAPRDGMKDELSHIIGVLPVIETALNRLGLYHFDQVAALNDENVRWVEEHLGIPGRIAREHWREQAHELSLAVQPRRAAAES